MTFITNDTYIHFDQNSNTPNFHMSILNHIVFSNVFWNAGDLSKSSQGIIRSNDIMGSFYFTNIYFNQMNLPLCIYNIKKFIYFFN